MTPAKAIGTCVAALAIGTIVMHAQKRDVPGIVNFNKVDATVACGGAVDPAALGGLKSDGFVAVIDLRLPSEPNVAAERTAAASAGLKYFHIPWSATAPDAAPVGQFLRVLDDKSNQPVYIHCAGGGRAAGMWMIKRVLRDGWPVEKALAEAEEIGMARQVLKDFVLDYIKKNGGPARQ